MKSKLATMMIDDPLNTSQAHNIPIITGGVGVEELSVDSSRRQELEEPIDGTAHAELPGNEGRQRADLSSTNSPRSRKPIGGFASIILSSSLLLHSQ
jgi:hypothetical protein